MVSFHLGHLNFSQVMNHWTSDINTDKRKHLRFLFWKHVKKTNQMRIMARKILPCCYRTEPCIQRQTNLLRTQKISHTWRRKGYEVDWECQAILFCRRRKSKRFLKSYKRREIGEGITVIITVFMLYAITDGLRSSRLYVELRKKDQ